MKDCVGGKIPTPGREWKESNNWKEWSKDKKQKEQEKEPASASTDSWGSSRQGVSRMDRPWNGWKKCFSCQKTNFAPGWGCMNPACDRNFDQQWMQCQAKRNIEDPPDEEEEGKAEKEEQDKEMSPRQRLRLQRLRLRLQHLRLQVRTSQNKKKCSRRKWRRKRRRLCYHSPLWVQEKKGSGKKAC